MSNALAVINNFDELEKTGGMMARSGLFKDSADAFKAMVKIQAGQELGVPPFQAMAGINIIHGKPVLSAGLLASLIKNHEDYDYKVGDHTELECVIVFMEKGDEAGVSSFSIDDAKRAGVFNTNPNWKKYPKNMLFARALSNGAKWYCAGIFGGSVYVEGEIVESEPLKVIKPRPASSPNQKTSNGNEATIEGEFEDSNNNQEEAHAPVVDNKAWFASLSPTQQSAAKGEWLQASEGISRYSGNIHQLKSAAKKIIEGGVDNFLLMKREGMTTDEVWAVGRNRVGLFDAVSMYATKRGAGSDEFDALKSVHDTVDGAFAELLKPIATDDINDITSASDATQAALIPNDDTPASQNAAMM